MIALQIILAVLVIMLISSIRVVPQATEFVIERLGKYKMTWSAGIHMLFPIIDRVSNRVSLKEQYF